MSKRTVYVLNNANNQRIKTGFIVRFSDILAVSRPNSSCLTVARFTRPDSPRAEKRAKKDAPMILGHHTYSVVFLSFRDFTINLSSSAI